MPFDEKNYIEEINKLTENDWKPLLDLIPEIEKEDSFGEMVMPETNEEGVISMPFWTGNKITDRFTKLVYETPVMIDFDWGSWSEGFEMLNNERFDYDKVDIPTKCKIITLITRKERFAEGTMRDAFESGLILKILKSIQKQLKE